MIKILMLEDDPLDQFIVTQLLSQIGYTNVVATQSSKRVKALIQKETPDLLILDVFFDGGTSIDLLQDPLVLNLPILFVTVCQEISIYESIKNNHRFGFLTKPLELISLRSTINMLLNRPRLIDPLPNPEEAIFLRQGNKQQRILFADILWLQADDNYTFIVTLQGRHVIKKPLKDTLAELDERFAQCHKRYVVNLHFIGSIKSKAVLVQDQEIPLSYFYKKEFLGKLHILRSTKAVSGE